MRKIQFRAWDKKDKIMWPSLTLQELIEGGWEWQTEDGEHSLPHNDYLAFAQQDTIWMQFTGLLDRSGKEIFEGDIIVNYYIHFKHNGVNFEKKCCNSRVRNPACSHYLIKYDNDNARFTANTMILSKPHIKTWVVIGNIYENPELLK